MPHPKTQGVVVVVPAPGGVAVALPGVVGVVVEARPMVEVITMAQGRQVGAAMLAMGVKVQGDTAQVPGALTVVPGVIGADPVVARQGLPLEVAVAMATSPHPREAMDMEILLQDIR